jgi:hypothetical protein
MTDPAAKKPFAAATPMQWRMAARFLRIPIFRCDCGPERR